MTDTQTKDQQVKVRLTTDLKIWLKRKATENRRTMNGEILFRLEQTKAASQPQGAQQ